MSEKITNSGEYQEGKLWFQRQGKTITLGLTDSAINEVGPVETVELPTEGEDFTQGDVMATVEGARGSLEIMTPMDGVVDAVNEATLQDPELVTEDPLEEGWLIRLKIQ